MGLFGPSGAEAARLEEEKKTRMEKIRQIKAQMQDDDGFIVETKTSFFGLIKTVTRTPKPTLEDRLTEVRKKSMAYREEDEDEDEEAIMKQLQSGELRPSTATSTVADDLSSKIPSTAKPETPNDVKSKLAAQMKTKEEEKKEEEKPVQGKTGLLAMLMKKKDEPDPSAKKAEEDEEELQDNYKEDKPPEKTPEPTTKPVWRAPASRQQTKSLTENFPCDLRESWCELRMYICSTGDDFLSERTAVMNALLPELQVRCASRRIRISAIDCWSSATLNYRSSFTLVPLPEDPESPDLFARLREIDRCAIFVAFCGRRFGDPISDDMFPPKLRLLSPHDLFLQELVESVNEAAFSNSKAVPLISMYSAEVEYGILRRSVTRCPLPHAHPLTISCLRSPMFLRKTPPDHQPFFKEEGDAIGALRRLRKSLAIHPSSTVFDNYDCKYGGISEEEGVPFVTEFEYLLDELVDAIWSWVVTYFPSLDESILSTIKNPVGRTNFEISCAAHFMHQQKGAAPVYVGHEDVFEDMLRYVTKPGDTSPYLLFGTVGVGKTATTIKFQDYYATQRPRARLKVIPYFCGCNTHSAPNPLRLLQYLCNSIMIHFDLGRVAQELEAQNSPVKRKIFLRESAEKARKQLFESSSEVKLPYKYPFLCELFRKLIACVSDSVIGDELLILIDAIDSLDATYLEPWPDMSLFDWLPPLLIDNGYPVRIILSCRSGPELGAFEEWGRRQGIVMPMKEILPLSSAEATQLVDGKLSLLAYNDGAYIIKQWDDAAARAARERARRNREKMGSAAVLEDEDYDVSTNTEDISKSILQKGALLLDDLDTSHATASGELSLKRSGRLPLYLSYAADIMWDYIQRQNGDPRTTLRVIRLTASLPNSFRDLIGNEIQRIEDTYDSETGWTRDFTCFLTVSRTGLLEIEAWQLLKRTFAALDEAGEAPVEVWRNIRTEFRKLLQPQADTSDNAMRWAHSQFTDVVQAKYLVHPKVAAGYHRALADYFNLIIQELRLEEIGMSLEKWLDACIISDESARALNEIAYHRIHSGAVSKSFEILTDLRYLEIRLLLGQLDDLVKDFSSAINFMFSKNKKFEATKLAEYRAFVLQTGWQLLKRPWASFQEAMNLPMNKAPSLYANELLQHDMEQRRWVKWINQVVDVKDCMRVEGAHKGGVVWFDTSDDGALLITIGDDSFIKAWSLHSGDFIVEIGSQVGAICVCWVPAGPEYGRCVVVIDLDGHCKLWSMDIALRDKTQNAVLDQVFVSKAPLRTMVVLSKYKELWISGDDLMIHVVSFDLVLLQRVRSLHNSSVKCCATSSCCSVVATGSDDKTIRVWRVSDRSVLVILVGHLSAVTSLCFSGIGASCLSSASRDGVLKVWQVDRGVVSSSMKADDGPVLAVAASRIGPQIVTGSHTGSLRMWDPDTFASSQTFLDAGALSSKEQSVLRASRIIFFNGDRQILVGTAGGNMQSYSLRSGHRSRVVKCQFYDNQRLITCSEDKSIRLWSTGVGNEVGKLIGHSARVNDFDCGVVDNTAVILTGSDDGTMLLWSLISGARLHRWDCTKKGVKSVLIHADSKIALAGCGDGCIRAYNCVSGQALYEARGHTGVIRRMLLALDARYIVSSCDDSSSRIWEVHNGQYASVLAGHTAAVTLAVIAADQNLVLTASKDLTLRAWNVSAALKSTVLTGHDGSLTCCAYLPDGQRVLTAANDNSFRVWNEDGECVYSVEKMKHTVRCAAVCKALGLVYLGDSGGSVLVLQAKDFSFNRTQEGSKERGWVVCVAVGVNGQYMVCCYQHGQCIVYDAQSGAELMTIDDSSDTLPLCVALSGDNKWMCVGHEDGHAVVYSVSKHSIDRQHSMSGHKFRVTALCFDPTNEYVATGSFDNTACVWHAINGICRNVLIGHSGPVTGMAFLSFGPFLITSSADRTARVWHILTGEQLFNLSSHSNAIVCVSLNSAGMVATASVDRTARLWDLRPPWGEKSGSEISCMRGHKGLIRDIKLEPNGRVGMSVSDDGSVRIWNVLKGTLTRHFTGHLYPVNTCAFLPIQGQESRYAMSADSQGMMCLWDIAEASEINSLKTSSAATACCVSNESMVALCDVDGNLHLFQPQGFENYEMAASAHGEGPNYAADIGRASHAGNRSYLDSVSEMDD